MSEVDKVGATSEKALLFLATATFTCKMAPVKGGALIGGGVNQVIKRKWSLK